MRRCLALLLVLVLPLAAPPGGASAEGALPTALRFDETDLAGPSGWILVTFQLVGTDGAGIQSYAKPRYTDGFEAHGLVLHEGAGVPEVHSWSNSDRDFGAAAAGASVDCCTRAGFSQSSGGGSISWGTRPGEGAMVQVAFFTANWAPGSLLWFNITAHGAGTIDVVDVSKGTDVEIVDLIDEAYRAGTNLRADPWMLGGSAPASGEIAFDAPGLLVGSYMTYGDEAVDFEVGLPDGSTFRDESEPGGWAELRGAAAAGERVTWRVDDVRERRDGFGIEDPADAHLYLVRLGLALPGASGFGQDHVF